MTYLSYRKPIQDLLIEDLKNLKYPDNTRKLLADVLPIMTEKALKTPVGELLPVSLEIQDEGISEDTRRYGFSLIVYDTIGHKATNAESKAVLDRLMYIEDGIIQYFKQLPHPRERAIPNIHIYRWDVTSSDITTIAREAGIGLVLQINIILNVIVNNKLS